MGKTNFTKRSLEALLPKEKRYAVFDRTDGLGIAVYPTGQKTFFYLKKVQGWPERRTIGAFPDFSVEQARGKAQELNGKLSKWKNNDYEGLSPFEKREKVPTFGELVDAYVERHLKDAEDGAKNPDRAAANTRWMVSRYLASWRNRRLGAIRQKDVLGVLRTIGEEHGRISANRVIELVRAMYNWAMSPDPETGIAKLWSGENPARGVKFFKKNERTRFLCAEELARLFTALRKEKNHDLRDFVLLALFTGARRNDVLSMRWADVDLASATWLVPDPKNEKPYDIALTPEAVEILSHRRNDSAWVFPSRGVSGHLVEPKRAWKLLLERAGISDLHIHDLRRTLGSWQAAQGSSLLIIGKSLGHSSTQATKVYARVDLGPVRASVVAATQAMLAASKKKPKRLPPAPSTSGAA